jgi:hypothetical protein
LLYALASAAVLIASKYDGNFTVQISDIISALPDAGAISNKSAMKQEV